MTISLTLAGCTKDNAPITEQAITPGFLTGTVTDVALLPIAGTAVTIDGMNLTATTDVTGAFQFELLPGEYVVLAMREEYRHGALRASVLSAQTSTLAFQLEAIPKIVPRVDVAEAEGYLACEALVLHSGEESVVPCGANDPNERPTIEFPLMSLDGLEGIVLELVWEARTDAARTLRVDVSGRAGEQLVALGRVEGTSPLKLTISGRLVSGDTLIATVSTAGGFTDEEASADAGFVLQQPFTGYASLFYHEAPQGGYSALSAQ